MAGFSEVEIFQAAVSVHIQTTSEEEMKIFLTKGIHPGDWRQSWLWKWDTAIPSTIGLEEGFCYKGWEFFLMLLCLDYFSVLALVESFRYYDLLREV